MGQGGSISENKSFILSNWVETKPNSNIFYNKVTNQQIQRHQVLINDKHELSSYSARMHDQSLLICRLIYFHPKSTPKEDTLKKHHAKHPSNQSPSDCHRAKSMLKQPSQLNIQQKSSPKNASSNQNQQIQPKVYCLYTDRMIPVKEWNKDKIIDVIEAFRKLTQVYGFFKVREHCICENQRKQIKIWINENPVSNFVVETVESEEDMIADLAALLVSRKQKIAKELLDLQYFCQVIEHFSKLSDYDHKKYINSGAPNSASNSNRTTGFPASNRQSQTSQPSFLPSQVKNFYNVFINTEKGYTVNSSLQNSKYNLINKGSFGYPYFASKGCNQAPPNSKDAEKEQNPKKQPEKTVNTAQYKTQNDIKVKQEQSPTQQGFLGSNITLGPSPTNFHSTKTDQKDSVKKINPQSYNFSLNHVSHGPIVTKESRNKAQESLQKIQTNYNFGQRDLTENTSIMLNAKKDTALPKNGSLDKQKDRQNANREENFTHKYMINSQKKTPSSIHVQNSNNLFSTQNPKSNVVPKFVPSTQQQVKNRSKNNSSGDVANKGNPPGENTFVFDSFGGVRKESALNLNSTQTTKTIDLQKEFYSNVSVEKPGSSIKNYSTPQNYSYMKPVSSMKERTNEYQRNLGQQTTKQQGISNIETKSFIRAEYNPAVRSKSKVFIKSNNFDQHNQGIQNYDSARNVVSQISTLKSPNTANQNPTLLNKLSKKSFPKYFQEKQSAKSIQKYYQKSLEQRQNSRALIGMVEQKGSPQKYPVGDFGGETFKYQHPRMQQVVPQVSDSEAYSQELIPPSNRQQAKNMTSDAYLKTPAQTYEPRRKFSSTTQGKPKKILDVKHFDQTECKKSKQGTEVDSQQSYEHLKTAPNNISQKHDQLKKTNNIAPNETQNKSCSMTKSYFSHLNTNNSVLVGNSQQYKNKIFATDSKKKKTFETTSKQDEHADGKFRFKDLENKQLNERNQVYSHGNQSSSGPFSRLEEKQSINYEEPKSRDSMVQIDETNGRNQSFPYPPNSVLRKNQKQFTFYNSNQKPTVVGNIEQIHPFEPSHNKGRIYLKKQSIKSVDEQQTLPRTTADQRQKRMFKQTRTSQVLIDTNQLHRSDPGHKIQQIVEKIEKHKEALMKKNAQQMIDEKLDVKQYPIFKKWQPSMNVFGSLINHQHSYGSCTKKKEYAKSQQQGTIDDKLSVQDSQKDQRQKIYPAMVNSQNLQTKKKIRKQVFMDYKGLFGDQDPFQKVQNAQQKERARKLEIKRQREQEERLLENASSKDLLIQEKVQKQKEKHAQLKSDLSRLFTQEV